MSIRRLLSIAALLTLAFDVARSQAPPATGPKTPPTGEIRGKVVGPAGQPVPNASITVRAGKDTSFAGGTLPRPDGSFVVDGLRPGAYAVRIRAIGYAPVIRTGIAVTPQSPADLGAVTLEAVATRLADQVVTAERDAVTLSPERNSYSVKGMTSVSGGNAVDALRNVPAVEVDASTNQVSLRGNSNVVVQINGRTSPLRGEQLGNFLSQIPAATLTRIEVTTSPSAKEDPEGTAGIINIVLAQEVEGSRTAGYSFGTGTTHLANGSVNAGIQSGPWTLFSSVSASKDPRSMTGLTARTNTAPVTSFSNAHLAGEMDPMSRAFIGRSEYRVTKTWAASLDAMATRARQGRTNLARFTMLDADSDTTGQFEDYSALAGRNLMQDYNAAFRRQGPKVNPFSIEARYTRLRFSTANLRESDPGDGSSVPALLDSMSVLFPTLAFQSDYSRALGKGAKIDVGVKSTRRELSSGTQTLRIENDAATTLRAGSIDYLESINAAYGMGARQVGKAQLQAGMRLEHTATRLGLTTRPAPLAAEYFSFFPNGAVNYALDQMTQLRASYSRRITRPQAPQLDPAERWETAQAVFRGNPDLKAEYTNAYEFGFQRMTGWGSFQVNPYARYTDDAVRVVRSVDENGVTTTTFANAATMRSIGADVNSSIRRGKLTVNLGGGMFDYRSEAGEFSTRTVTGRAQMSATYAPSRRWDGQIQANYLAPQGVEGGTRLANFMSVLATRWKIRGDASILTLRVVDPFDTQRMRIRTRTGAVTEDVERRVGVRGVFLTFSGTFGQQLKLRPPQELDPASQMGSPPV